MLEKFVMQEKLKMVWAIPEPDRLLIAEPLLLMITWSSLSMDRLLSPQAVNMSFTNTGPPTTDWKTGSAHSLLGWEHQPVRIP